ncbi:MAG: choice-of-anchor I family protein [Verrucomicrobiales bacterium]
MYMPDAIVAFEAMGETFIISANEGDSRDYDGFSEEARVEDLDLDPTAFPNAAELQSRAELGRLKTTTTLGDTDGDGDYDEIYAFGGRSFSIWDAKGNLVFDSGDQLERLVAEYLPANFNASNDSNGFDGRSDDKGPEPEGLAIGQLDGRTYAFLGLERVGGVMIFDITYPYSPVFVDYFNNRDFSADPEDELELAGDLGPEGLKFIPASDSPNGKPLLAVGQRGFRHDHPV